MGRKSQVEKFNARLSKKKKDEIAINTREYQKRQEDAEKYGAEGVDELMKQGSIKEAAVVFSHEGMKAFANMFGNSVEKSVVNVLSSQMDTITKNLEDKMSAIIEAKMLEMLEGMTEGMKKLSQPQTEIEKAIKFADTYGGSAETLKDDISSEQAEAMTAFFKKMFPNAETLTMSRDIVETTPEGSEWKEYEPGNKVTVEIEEVNPQAKFEKKVKDFRAKKEEPKNEEPKVEPKKESVKYTGISTDGLDLPVMDNPDNFRYSTSKADAELIKEHILAIFKKYAGMELKSSDVTHVLREEYNIRMLNPTLTYKHIMSSDYNFEKVGAGVYKYEEKTFQPTI